MNTINTFRPAKSEMEAIVHEYYIKKRKKRLYMRKYMRDYRKN